MGQKEVLAAYKEAPKMGLNTNLMGKIFYIGHLCY